jgi:LemA protein
MSACRFCPVQACSHSRTTACKSPCVARHTVSGAATWIPGGASCKAAPELGDLRRAHRLFAAGHHVTADRQHPERHAGQAARAGGFRRARRAHDQDTLEAQCRDTVLIQVGQSMLESFRQPSLVVRQDDGQGARAAAAQPRGDIRQLLGRGHPQCPFALVEKARRLEQHDSQVGGGGRPLPRAIRRDDRRGRPAQAIGERLARQHLRVLEAHLAHQPPHDFVAEHPGRAHDDEPRFARCGWHGAACCAQHLKRLGSHPIYATVAGPAERKTTMLRWLLIIAAALSLGGCGYNDFQRLDEQSKSAWSEVLNQYQRRADLVPNLVGTVKGEANFEQETLTKVIEARAKATSVQVTPETLNDPQAMQRFQQAQGELSSALSRLIAVSERYPDLKANQSFRELRVQLEGTENRITVARNRYIQTVQEYNVLARSFPTNLTAMIFHYEPKANFTVQNEAQISTPPQVDFNKK